MASLLRKGVYTAMPMPQQLDTAKLSEALNELGVTQAALLAIRVATPERGKQLVAELKLMAKSRYRKLAFALHPDRNPGDAASAAKFSFLSIVMKQVEGMEYRPPAPVQHPQQRTVVFQRVVFQTMPGNVAPSRPPMRVTAVPSGTPRGVHVVFLRPT
jgi:hypothetical protein